MKTQDKYWLKDILKNASSQSILAGSDVIETCHILIAACSEPSIALEMSRIGVSAPAVIKIVEGRIRGRKIYKSGYEPEDSAGGFLALCRELETCDPENTPFCIVMNAIGQLARFCQVTRDTMLSTNLSTWLSTDADMDEILSAMKTLPSTKMGNTMFHSQAVDASDQHLPKAQSEAKVNNPKTGSPAKNSEPQKAKPAPEPDGPVTAQDAVRNALRDLTIEAAENMLDPVIGREAEIALVLSSIRRRRKPGVILHGAAGVGKTAIAEGVAQALHSDPDYIDLRSRPVWEVSLASLVGGARYRGDFESRMSALLKMASEARAILFIDEIHMIMGVGATTSGPMDGANILKPALARGDITVIGATTTDEIRHIQADKALMRRFSLVHVEEPDENQTRQILERIVPQWLQHFGISLGSGVTDAIIEGGRYLPARRQPDKSLDMLDIACVMATADEEAVLRRKHIHAATVQLGGYPPRDLDDEMITRLQRLAEHVEVFTESDIADEVAADVGLAMTRRQDGPLPLLWGISGAMQDEFIKGCARIVGLPVKVINVRELPSIDHLLGEYPERDHWEPGLLPKEAQAEQERIVLIQNCGERLPDVAARLAQIADTGIWRSASGSEVSFSGLWIILHNEGGAAAIGFNSRSESPSGRFGAAFMGACTRSFSLKTAGPGAGDEMNAMAWHNNILGAIRQRD